MAESNATERYETCVRQHSRTCTCGIDAAPVAARVCHGCGYSLVRCYDCKRGGALKCCPDCDHSEASTEPKPVSPLISQEVLDGVTVAGARAFWALKDLEKQHESLRADVMTIASDPHLEWDEARTMLMAALNAK